jgi:hypothetical protein
MRTPSAEDIFSPLRPYQIEAGRAIVESAVRGKGLSFSVAIARQGGKNELSARIELLLLTTQNVWAVKAAPTLRPQAMISLRRLWGLIESSGLSRWAAKEEGRIIRLGRASQVFLSAEPDASIVGHTANLLLEIDEAQDVDIEKFDKELWPMAASTGATTVLYGTTWDDSNLLERARQAHLEAERRDGVRRHFEYDWEVVGASNAAYARFVAAERERLGPDHPLFLTQYCLKTIPGGGRLFTDSQLSLLRGSHQALEGLLAGELYVGGLDLGDEGRAGEHDATVLSIGRVLASQGPLAEGQIEVVRQYSWSGAPHAELHGALASLIGSTWRLRRLAVDATGLGEPAAAFLKKALPGTEVVAAKLSAETKSRLGYELLATVNRGGLRLHVPDGRQAAAECWRQLRACRAVYRANRLLNFFVEQRDGHDDHVVSLALVVEAAREVGPRRARGRGPEQQSIYGGLQW